MEIDFEHSRLKIGIRDFVSFAQSSYPSTPVHNLGNWRTTLGQQWHQQLWKEAQDQFGENAKAEVCIEGSLHYEGWTFALSGRIDQILYDEDQTVLREVKTTQQLLPQPLAELRAKYPDYFEQLACYQLLLPESFRPEGIPLVPELLMLHIDTGIRQILHLDRPPMEILQPRLASWLDFLEGQRSADRRVKHLVVPTAFETFREDQIPVRELLFRQLEEPGKANASGNKAFIALQAATGFGKTSIAIEWALQGIRQGQFDRVLYLTGKNTGQKQVVDELQRFRQDSEGIRYFQVRNMEQHLRFCPHLHCPCQHRDSGQAATPQLESYLPYVKVDTLIKQGSPDMETIGMTASTYQVCPRLISQSALAISEFWVADYNYVFTPGARTLLDSIPAFNPGRCLLILDEVHNLHERVCSNFSATFNSYRGEQVIAALRDTRAPRPFMSAVDALVRFVRSLSEKQVLDTTQTYQLKDLLESIHRQMADNGRTLVNLPESIMEILWELEVAWQSVQNPRLEMVHWCPRDGSIDITCIHASSIIRETVDSFRKTLFMSATFPAPEVFHEQTRIPSTECLRIDAGSEWRAACYEVGIDARISTTYKNREKNYRKTAQTLLQLRESDPGAVIAFFPSYQYAETIAAYLRVMAPHLETFTLPRAMHPEEQIEAIGDAVYRSDILCLPLGSGLSEGIDTLGGRVQTVMVVSPALPEVNPVQQARSERFPNNRSAFHHVYQIPGMTKVNQALGRIVRDPAHRARVLLHCDRFADSDYRGLLSSEYQDATIIRNDREFERWLRSWTG